MVWAALRDPQKMPSHIPGSRFSFPTVLIQLYCIESCNPDVKKNAVMLVLPHQSNQCCEAGASPLGWPGINQWIQAVTVNSRSGLTRALNTQPWGERPWYPQAVSLLHFVSPFAALYPTMNLEKFLKLAPWNRKCRFPHGWTRWAVHKWRYRRTRFALCYVKRPSPVYSDLSFSKWTGTRWKRGKWTGLS